MLGSRAALVLFSLLLASPAFSGDAGSPQLLADVNRQPGVFGAAAHGFFPAGGRLVFWTDGSGDIGLWSTDGTPQTPQAVTWLPFVLCPDGCNITPVGNLHGNALLIIQTGEFESPESIGLWRTDGTIAGTYPLTPRVTEFPEGTLVAGPGGDLYFTACAASCGLWRSDGTPAGTRVVRDFAVAPFSGMGPHGLTAWHGRLYFFAGDGNGAGSGLWSTDGTAAGTVFLAPTGEGEDWPELLGATASQLFFTAGDIRQELWVTDGTAAGTGQVRAFEPARCVEDMCAVINSFQASGGGILFGVHDETLQEEQYWSSDGTAAGTRRLLSFSGSGGEDPRLDFTLRRIGSRWFLLAQGSLWVSDGDLGSAAPLSGCDGGCPTAIHFVGTESRTGGLLFAGSDPDHGTELWITDGTGPGTRRLADVCPGPCDGNADGVSPSGSIPGMTLFAAAPEQFNSELWTTDGTPAGTHRLSGLDSEVGILGGVAVFSTGGEIWATDGTAAGTRRLKVLQAPRSGSNPFFAPVRDGVVFLAVENDRQNLWASDGTPAGTSRILDVASLGPDAVFRSGLLAAGRLQFFSLQTANHGGGTRQDFWRTDGTEQGTLPILPLPPGEGIDTGAEWNGKLLFEVEGPLPDRCAWWLSDGTPTGTREILPARQDIHCAHEVQPLGSRFLFVSLAGTGRVVVPQLFVSDGTPAGTRQLSHVQGARNDSPAYFTRSGGISFFVIGGRKDPRGLKSELWRSDGTPQGTYRVLQLPQTPDLPVGFRGSLYVSAALGPQDDSPTALWRLPLQGKPVLLHTFRANLGIELTPLGDRLLFTADGGDGYGIELWQTDGTPAGTTRVTDINPGAGSSSPGGFAVAGERVLFSARDGEHGFELWESDGTAAGTRMVQDINPGPFASWPYGVVSGANFFFAADDGVTGVEPWVLPLGPP